jgi:hypothetical protein
VPRPIYPPSEASLVAFSAWPEDGDLVYRVRAVVAGRDGKVLQTTPEILTRVEPPTPEGGADLPPPLEEPPPEVELPLTVATPSPTPAAAPSPIPPAADPGPRLAFDYHPGPKTTRLINFRLERLKVGTTIRIAIAEPGEPTVEATIKIRARRGPSATTSYLRSRSAMPSSVSVPESSRSASTSRHSPGGSASSAGAPRRSAAASTVPPRRNATASSPAGSGV